MKAVLNLQTSGRDQSVEVVVENWPRFIRKGECFHVSACGLAETGIAEITSIIWTYSQETFCLIDCIVKEEVLDELLSSSKLKSVRPPTYLLPEHRWKGNKFD